MLTKLKLVWPFIRKFAIQFYCTTPCKECLRGRFWVMFALGVIVGELTCVYISLIALLMVGIHVGRKNNWWLYDQFD